MNFKYCLLLFLSVIFQLNVLAQSTTKTFAATKDNSIYAESDNSNGIGDYLFAGNTAGKNPRRALFSFQISIPILPESKLEINNVILRLNVNKTFSLKPTVFTLHRLLKDWGEFASNANNVEGQGITAKTGDATWVYNKFNASSWTKKGGDFVTVPSATFTITELTDQTISSAGLLTDVKFWLSNPAQNFGWILIGDETIGQTAFRFDSKENASLLGPRLELNYSIVTAIDNTNNFTINKLVYLPESSSIQYLDNQKDIDIQLFDISGKQVLSSTSGIISTNRLNPGFYIVRSINNGTVLQTKFYIYQ